MQDVAAEASMAQNLTLNVGGYTPHMAVTGTMSYPFSDFNAPGIISTSSAQQPATSVFETALRLRQIALTSATQSITGAQIVRAGRTRPQQLEVTSFKPGVTEVDFTEKEQMTMDGEDRQLYYDYPKNKATSSSSTKGSLTSFR